MKYLIDIIDTSNEPNIINQILDNQNTHNMKQYIATFRVLNAAFNTNDIETMWISASTKAHATEKAKFYANEYGNKFISIRAVN